MTDKRNKLQTEKDLLSALARLIELKPKNKSLIERLQEKGILKINKSLVEKEAGLSNGASKRHQVVLDAIDAANIAKEDSGSNNGVSSLTSSDVKQHPTYIKLDKKCIKLLDERRQGRNKIDLIQEELTRKDEALESQLALSHELLLCMWQAIPPADIDGRMHIMREAADVIHADFSKKKKAEKKQE